MDPRAPPPGVAGGVPVDRTVTTSLAGLQVGKLTDRRAVKFPIFNVSTFKLSTFQRSYFKLAGWHVPGFPPPNISTFKLVNVSTLFYP